MPLFDFECRACKNRYEAMSRHGEPLPVCPACGSAEIDKIQGMGGAVAAVDYMKSALVASHAQRRRRIEAGEDIIVGLNQTTLAALSMATIASFVNGPGLGKPVLDGLRINDTGTALVPAAQEKAFSASCVQAEKVQTVRGRLLQGQGRVQVDYWMLEAPHSFTQRPSGASSIQ